MNPTSTKCTAGWCCGKTCLRADGQAIRDVREGICAGCANELIAMARGAEERETRLRLNVTERRYVDATSDADIAARILESYIDETTATDNLLGLPPESPLLKVMNETQRARNLRLREAIGKLRGSP